jgi:hypothetical protein
MHGTIFCLFLPVLGTFAPKICVCLVYCELINYSFYLHLTYLLLRVKQGQLTAGSLRAYAFRADTLKPSAKLVITALAHISQ